jgi:hypothetical protein
VVQGDSPVHRHSGGYSRIKEQKLSCNAVPDDARYRWQHSQVMVG